MPRVLSSPKLPSLCVDICTLTCDNAEQGKVFLHRKSATMTGYHDGSLRWSDRVARRHDLALAKAQVSAGIGVPPPSNFGLAPGRLVRTFLTSFRGAPSAPRLTAGHWARNMAGELAHTAEGGRDAPGGEPAVPHGGRSP